MNFLLKVFVYNFTNHSKICIIGGGTGGINVAAHLIRSQISRKDISIFEPHPYHYYQPGWTMVGNGMINVETTRKKLQQVIPKRVHLVKQGVKQVKPQQNLIITNENHEYIYDHLIISSGFKLDWDKIKGAKQLLQSSESKVGSIYDYKYAEKTSKIGQAFKGGKAIFTQPPQPIKCAGAPQKILYLWTNKWLQKKVQNMEIQFIKAQPVMFSVPKYSQALQKLAKQYKINLTFNHNLVQITSSKAIFQNVKSKQKLQKPYDFLHIVPPMSPPNFIKQSGLSNQQGYVDVDKQTLRHTKYANIWSLGDSSSLPTSKTAAAVFSQTQILVKNLMTQLKHPQQKQPPSHYDGYTSCPIFVGNKKVVLAEFLYDHKIDESFFSKQQKPSRTFYYLTRYVFPFVYWKLMPRGMWQGKKGIRWSQYL